MIPNICHTLFSLSDKTINSYAFVDYTDDNIIKNNMSTPTKLWTQFFI